MADTKISGLTAAAALAGADTFAVVQGGLSRQATLTQIGAYPGNGGIYSVTAPASAQTPFATDTYLTGSLITIPGGVQAGTFYRCLFWVTKTAAGIAAPVITLRYGTAGTTADAARCTLTFPAQTAAIDTAMFELMAIFRTVGAGTSAVLFGFGKISHSLAATGFSTANNGLASSTSAGFDSTVAASKIGLSVNGGTSAAWSVTAVEAELRNVT